MQKWVRITGLVVVACRRMLCSIEGRLLNYFGEVYLSKPCLIILIRMYGVDRCDALSPALTNGWSRIAHKQALERCLGLIVFGKIREVCSSVALEGSSVKTCTAGY